MICHDVQDRLTDALLGEVPPAVREELLDHAARCVACAQAAEELGRTLELLRASSWPVEAVLGDAERRRLFERAAAPRRPVRWLAIAASLAAVAAAAALVLPALRRPAAVPPSPEAGPTVPAVVPTPTRVAAVPPPAVTLPAARPSAPGRARMAPVPSSSPEPAAPPPTPAPPAQYTRQVEPGMPWPGRVQEASPVPGAAASRDAGLFSVGLASDFDHRVVAPPAGMSFEHRRANPWVATERDHLSTFGLDVDTASYAIARSYIRRGLLPPPDAVRVEEFVNALPADEPAPAGGEAFGIAVETAPSPFAGGRTFLRVSLRARDVPRRDRKPARLVFLVDVSGSMRLENRLELVKRSLELLVDRLDERDSIGIVAYGSAARVVLQATPASEREAILEAVARLQPEGSTHLEQGLQLAYAMAAGGFDERAVNRVVLCTDGVANSGVTDPQALLALVKHRATAGIDLIALGFGMGNYDDALLQRLADEGDGQYAYVDDFAGARRFFLRDLAGILETVARDARAQVEFDPDRVEGYRLLGYEKRGLRDDAFRDDAADAGEVNAGQTVTVLYELRLTGVDGPLGVVRVRFQDPVTRAPSELQRTVPYRAPETFEEASPQLQLAVLAARFADLLRASRFVPPSETLDGLARLARRLPAATREAPGAEELVELIRDAARLSRTAPPR